MRNRITDEELDAALAESFPASDPLPMSPGTDSVTKRLRSPKADEAPAKKMVNVDSGDNRPK